MRKSNIKFQNVPKSATKSAKLHNYSLSQQNSVRFFKDFTPYRIFFTPTLLAHWYVFASLIMISNTTGGLYIEYSNTFLQKDVFSPHITNVTLIYGLYSCLIIVLFGPIFMGNFVIFSIARPILELMH